MEGEIVTVRKRKSLIMSSTQNIIRLPNQGSQDSAVGIATGYGLDDQGVGF
jgi:hypothetical protein